MKDTCKFLMNNLLFMFICASLSEHQNLPENKMNRISLGMTPGIFSDYQILSKRFLFNKSQDEKEVWALLFGFFLNGFDNNFQKNQSYIDCLNKYWLNPSKFSPDPFLTSNITSSINCDEKFNQSLNIKLKPQTVFDLYSRNIKLVSSKIQIPCWWLSFSKSVPDKSLSKESSIIDSNSTMETEIEIVAFDGVWLEDFTEGKLNKIDWFIQRMRARTNELKFKKILRNLEKPKLKNTGIRFSNKSTISSFIKIKHFLKPIKHDLKKDLSFCSEKNHGYLQHNISKITGFNLKNKEQDTPQTLIYPKIYHDLTTWEALANFVQQRGTVDPFYFLTSFKMQSECPLELNKGTFKGSQTQTYMSIDITKLFHSWMLKTSPWRRRQSKLMFLLYPKIGSLSTDINEKTSAPQNFDFKIQVFPNKTSFDATSQKDLQSSEEEKNLNRNLTKMANLLQKIPPKVYVNYYLQGKLF